jgi:hypothetical protein
VGVSRLGSHLYERTQSQPYEQRELQTAPMTVRRSRASSPLSPHLNTWTDQQCPISIFSLRVLSAVMQAQRGIHSILWARTAERKARKNGMAVA